MDIGEISKVAGRKRVNVEVEQLREKVSRETAKIIKLKVAQDTALWDVKEKLQQVEGNHERLQQNMVEVQMQHETISGQYQDEIRLRPETLNKLSSTREICDVLEDYSERLKQTLSRCKADQATLCDAYQKSGAMFRDIKSQHQVDEQRNRQLVANLEEKVKLSGEHQKQMMQIFTSTKEHLEGELNHAKDKLCKEQELTQELKTIVNDLNKKVDVTKFELDRKEETIAKLQCDMKQLIHEFNVQSNEVRNNLAKKEKELKEATEANIALKKAMTHQEQFARSVCDHNTTLQDKIAALEEELAKMSGLLDGLRNKLEEATSIHENINKDMKTVIEEKHNLQVEIKQKDELLNDTKLELDNLNEKLKTAERDNSNLVVELNKCIDEVKTKDERVKALVGETESLEDKINDINNTFNDYRKTSQESHQNLAKQIEEKDKELDLKASTITQLMSELKTSTDVRSKLENSLQRVKKELEGEKECSKEIEMKMGVRIEQLEMVIRDKESELSKQMSIILDMRNEKDRLQEKISGMQGTIDNIQKELNGRPAPRPAARPPAERPEPDDNAVMLTPSTKGKNSQKPVTSSPILSKREFAVPRDAQPLDTMLYTLFSDSSMDGDTVDASEVNRRFSAISRGERIPAVPLSALKRRGGVPASQNIMKPAKRRLDDIPLSLSQVKNDLKNKEKTFFKSKRERVDTKLKKK